MRGRMSNAGLSGGFASIVAKRLGSCRSSVVGGCIGANRPSNKTVVLVVKAEATRSDLDPTRLTKYSLRAGLVMTCALAGVADDAITQ
jgi:hypothetical protein